MGPTRYPNGQAIGFVNQFNYAGGTAGNISGSATPNVTLGGLFYANNTGSVQITNLILDDTANRLANYEGKVIRIFMLDTGSTSMANAGSLFLAGTNDLAGQNNSIELMHSRGNWYELDRSYINRTEYSSINIGGTMSINVDRVSFVALVGTGGAANTIASISGGELTQRVTLRVASGGANILITSAGNIWIGGTNAVTLLSSGVYDIIKTTASNWSLFRNNLFV